MRRARAFACTRPLHRLEADKGQVQSVDLAPYPLDQLALDAIELVAMHQEFQDGLTRDELAELLAEEAGRHARNRTAAEHDAVARRISIELINAHQLSVPEIAPDGSIGQVVMTLRLLTEHQAHSGRIYLRAGAEAINVLIDRLDVDAASESHAAELRLRLLVSRGSMTAARDVAHAMRLLSVGFMEQTRRYVDAVRRNLDEVDWIADLAPHLEQAHEHLEQRLSAEHAIIAELEDALISGHGADREAALEAVALLRGTHRTHAELLVHLAGVHRAFVEAQDTQRFRHGLRSVRLADLRADVVGGFMALTMRDADALAPHPVEPLLGAVIGPVITLADIVDRVLAPSGDAPSARPVDVPELVDDVPDESLRRALLEHLGDDDVDGRLLSELLAAARPHLDDEALWTLATIAAEAFGAEHLAVLGGADVGDEPASVPDEFVVAFRAGAPLHVPSAPWLTGDDLRFVACKVDEDSPA